LNPGQSKNHCSTTLPSPKRNTKIYLTIGLQSTKSARNFSSIVRQNVT